MHNVSRFIQIALSGLWRVVLVDLDPVGPFSAGAVGAKCPAAVAARQDPARHLAETGPTPWTSSVSYGCQVFPLPAVRACQSP